MSEDSPGHSSGGTGSHEVCSGDEKEPEESDLVGMARSTSHQLLAMIGESAEPASAVAEDPTEGPTFADNAEVDQFIDHLLASDDISVAQAHPEEPDGNPAVEPEEEARLLRQRIEENTFQNMPAEAKKLPFLVPRDTESKDVAHVPDSKPPAKQKSSLRRGSYKCKYCPRLMSDHPGGCPHAPRLVHRRTQTTRRVQLPSEGERVVFGQDYVVAVKKAWEESADHTEGTSGDGVESAEAVREVSGKDWQQTSRDESSDRASESASVAPSASSNQGNDPPPFLGPTLPALSVVAHPRSTSIQARDSHEPLFLAEEQHAVGQLSVTSHLSEVSGAPSIPARDSREQDTRIGEEMVTTGGNEGSSSPLTQNMNTSEPASLEEHYLQQQFATVRRNENTPSTEHFDLSSSDSDEEIEVVGV